MIPIGAAAKFLERNSTNNDRPKSDEGEFVGDGIPRTAGGHPYNPLAGGYTFDDDCYWESCTELREIRDFAVWHMVSPYAVLACVLARIVAATPPHIVLPALVGASYGSLNFGVVLLGGRIRQGHRVHHGGTPRSRRQGRIRGRSRDRSGGVRDLRPPIRIRIGRRRVSYRVRERARDPAIYGDIDAPGAHGTEGEHPEVHAAGRVLRASDRRDHQGPQPVGRHTRPRIPRDPRHLRPAVQHRRVHQRIRRRPAAAVPLRVRAERPHRQLRVDFRDTTPEPDTTMFPYDQGILPADLPPRSWERCIRREGTGSWPSKEWKALGTNSSR